jgi:hypothetical protein
MHGLAVALTSAAILGYCERNLAEVERCSSNVIELSTRHHFAFYFAAGFIPPRLDAQRFRQHG